MRDILWKRVLRTDARDAYIGCLAGFAECVVARVKVFAFLNSEKKHDAVSFFVFFL